MTIPRPVSLGEGRLLVDLGFRDTDGLVASYLLPQSDGWTLIETGPTTCRDRLLAGLALAGVDRSSVRRVFVTHIHLDHAGGIGALAAALPNATFFAHADGIAHLVDPSRLIASARRAWGAAADPLWGEIVPTPADRLVALHGGESFDLVPGRLEVLATPGHARHHLSYFDTRIRGVFTGDSAGVRLAGAARPRPAIPPPDLDLEALFGSLDRMSATDPARLFYAHFGESPDGPSDLRTYRGEVERWRSAALTAAREEANVEAIVRSLKASDRASSVTEPTARTDAERGADLISGYELAAQGLLRYFRTHGLIAE